MLPCHPVPCALIGRLAVDRSARGLGLGRMLLADAVKRVVAAGETVAMHPLIVDAANDDTKRFYEGFGLVPLTDDPMRLFLPLGHAALRSSYRNMPWHSVGEYVRDQAHTQGIESLSDSIR